MSDAKHVALLRQGVDVWNGNRPGWPDLSGEDLSGLDLTGVELTGANITDANLQGAKLDSAKLQGVFLSGSDLSTASLKGANLYYARLVDANLNEANLTGAKLVGATLDAASLHRTNLRGANLQATHFQGTSAVGADLSETKFIVASLFGTDLTEANLTRAQLGGSCLVQTVIERANFNQAMVYGIAAWDLIGQPASSEDLVISRKAHVTVSDLRVAQLVYLMLENSEIRAVIDALTSKLVLILGSFSETHKATLDELRLELRKRDLVPVVFDFDKPADLDLTETITLLARMARFIIADVSDGRSVPQELQAIAPQVEVPILPIVNKSDEPWSMFPDLQKYPWVLPLRDYPDNLTLVRQLDNLIASAEAKRREILARRSEVERSLGRHET